MLPCQWFYCLKFKAPWGPVGFDSCCCPASVLVAHTASFLLATGWPWPFTDPTANGGLRLTYPCCWGGTYCVLPLGSGLSSFLLTLGDGGSLSTLCLWVGLSLWPPEDRGLLCSNREREQRGVCSSGEQSDALGQSLAKTTASLCHESWISLAGRLLGTRVEDAFSKVTGDRVHWG